MGQQWDRRGITRFNKNNTNAQSASLRRFLATESNVTENNAAESNAVDSRVNILHSSNGR